MTSEVTAPLGGTERSAILLLTVGERLASDVLKYLDPKEVQKLGMAISRMKTVSRKEVSQTLQDFLAQAGDRMPLGIGSEEYLLASLGNAVGKERAKEFVGQIMAGRLAGMDAVRHMSAGAVADLLRNEHPQIAAIVLANLKPDHAAEVLALLPEGQRPGLLTRIASLESLPPAALKELDAIIDQKVSDAPGIHSSRIGDIKAAVDLLNHLDRSLGADILDSIRQEDPDLGVTLDEALFAFEDLMEVADRDIQSLLKEVPSDLLVKSLKAADEGLKEKIFRNMSKRAAELIRDDIEGTGPVRLADVELAQKAIVRIARRLAEKGDITLAAGRQEGLRQGAEEVRDQLQVLRSLIGTLARPLAQLDSRVEEELVALTVTLVRQLLRREVRTEPGVIVAAVREALAVLPLSAREIVIKVHPEDAALLRELYPEQAVVDGPGWRLLESPAITRGGCVVVTSTSEVDATIERRLAAAIRHVFGGDRPADPPADADWDPAPSRAAAAPVCGDPEVPRDDTPALNP